ncbi:hypothetical protein SCLCIDRAFT_1220847 [Scleroderma citrinum Foug A]|uniref:DUF6593 domain-containing protein n=1 Tax=Scleroderma citrinum Foug A TaxID=1036808 RepID=A0A0C3DIG5_9AGAM|nr:hypothetical protein SCLCIDRAFT_1220847 [Scleroderma citrinum Foug A]
MKLVFSDDFVRHAIIGDERGNVIYQVTTPREALGTPRKSTVWKAIQPVQLPATSGSTSHGSDEASINIDTSNLGHVRELEQRLEHQGFKRLGGIEWHVFSPSKLWMFGGTSGAGDLSGEGIGSNEFIPAKGGLRRERAFKGPDGNTYHWELGYFECTLYRDDGTSNHTPIAKYHRRRNFWLPFIQTQDKGYLEINATLQPSMGIDKKSTDSFYAFESDIADGATVKSVAAASSVADIEPLIRSQSSELDGDMLDLLVFTYIYVEKLRKDREQVMHPKDPWTVWGMIHA